MTGSPVYKPPPPLSTDKRPLCWFLDLEINLWWPGTFSRKPKKTLLAFLKDNSPDITISLLIFLYLWTETSVFLLLGTRPLDYGIWRLVKLSDNSLDTRKKFSPSVSPLITDRLFLLVLIKKSNYGIPLLIANILPTPITIKTGFLKSDTLLNWRPKPNLPSNLTSPL